MNERNKPGGHLLVRTGSVRNCRKPSDFYFPSLLSKNHKEPSTPQHLNTSTPQQLNTSTPHRDSLCNSKHSGLSSILSAYQSTSQSSMSNKPIELPSNLLKSSNASDREAPYFLSFKTPITPTPQHLNTSTPQPPNLSPIQSQISYSPSLESSINSNDLSLLRDRVSRIPALDLSKATASLRAKPLSQESELSLLTNSFSFSPK